MQIDDVEIRRVGERVAPEPAQPEDEQLATRKLAMPLLELTGGCFAKRNERAFGDAGVSFGHLERIAAAVDQLHPEREAAFVDQPSDPIEPDIIGLAAHRLAKQS